MCLFLTALLRDGRIDVEEYAIEIRAFCVNFLWVVQAAEVHTNLLVLMISCTGICPTCKDCCGDKSMISRAFTGHGLHVCKRDSRVFEEVNFIFDMQCKSTLHRHPPRHHPSQH